MVAAPAFLPSSRTFRCEPSSSASVPLTTPSPRALQWQRHRLWPRSARLHRGPPCATATDGVSPRSQPEAPAASSAPWLTADPCTDTTAFVGRGPAPTTAAPLSAHHDARSLLRRRRLARSSVSPTMLDPILGTLPLAVVMKPLGTGVALDTLLGHEQHHAPAPTARGHASDSARHLGPNGHGSGTPGARGSPTTALATSRSGPQWPRACDFRRPSNQTHAVRPTTGVQLRGPEGA